MTTASANDPFGHLVDSGFSRPLPAPLVTGRRDLLAAIGDLRTIADSDLARPWPWKGGSEEEIRYGFHRIAEAFELAGIDAQARIRAAGIERGRAADRIAPATAARWDLQGLLLPLPDLAWDADPGDEEWTVRQTIAHVIQGQRYYGVGIGWWQGQAYSDEVPTLPPMTPEVVYEGLPNEEDEGAGTPSEVRDRLGDVLDRSSAALGGLPAERLGFGSRWSGFAVDIDFRLGRWSSHIREHTVQVEKTLAMIDHRRTENDRLVRLILAAWGCAEAVVYGAPEASDAASPPAAAAEARLTATDLLRHIRA